MLSHFNKRSMRTTVADLPDIDPNDPRMWRGMPLEKQVEYVERRLVLALAQRDTYHAQVTAAEQRNADKTHHFEAAVRVLAKFQVGHDAARQMVETELAMMVLERREKRVDDKDWTYAYPPGVIPK